MPNILEKNPGIWKFAVLALTCRFSLLHTHTWKSVSESSYSSMTWLLIMAISFAWCSGKLCVSITVSIPPTGLQWHYDAVFRSVSETGTHDTAVVSQSRFTNPFFDHTAWSHDRTPPSRQLRRRLAATPRSLHGTISAISIILSQQIDDNDVSHNHYIQSTFPWSFSVPSAMCLSGVCFLVIQLVVLHEYGTCCMHSSRICQILIALIASICVALSAVWLSSAPSANCTQDVRRLLRTRTLSLLYAHV